MSLHSILESTGGLIKVLSESLKFGCIMIKTQGWDGVSLYVHVVSAPESTGGRRPYHNP